MSVRHGPLALCGGAEWTPGCETADRELLAASGATDVVVLPTAAAYEHPERRVLSAVDWYESLGARVEGLMVLGRADAEDAGVADVVRRARFLHLCDGSSLHLRSVLKGSLVWSALCEAWAAGAVVVGSGAGASVLTDPMVDPRGGALTVGLGLVGDLAVLTHFDPQAVHRSVLLAPEGLAVVGIPERTTLIVEAAGSWRQVGAAEVTVHMDGKVAAGGLSLLAPR